MKLPLLLALPLTLATAVLAQRMEGGSYEFHSNGHAAGNTQEVADDGNSFTDTDAQGTSTSDWVYDSASGRYIRQIPPGQPQHLRFVPIDEGPNAGGYNVFRYIPPKPAHGNPGDPDYQPATPGIESASPVGQALPRDSDGED